MIFKGSFGKIIVIEDAFITIKEKSFLFGSFEKRIPYSRIKDVEIAKTKSSSYIRIIELEDERVFDKKNGFRLASSDDNSVLFSNEKKYDSAIHLKEVIEAKKSKQNKSSEEEKTIIIGKRKSGKLFFLLLILILFTIFQCSKNVKGNKKIPIYEQFNMSEEEFSNMEKIFETCGFSEITKIEKSDELDDGTTSYYIEMKGIAPNKIIAPGKTEGNIIFVEITQDKMLSEISVNFNPIFKDGRVLNKVVAFTKITPDEETECQFICQKTVKKILKSPSSAKFCEYTDYSFLKDNGIITAQGFVDSENSFGAMTRTYYTLTYNCVTKKAVSINIDGTSYDFN